MNKFEEYLEDLSVKNKLHKLNHKSDSPVYVPYSKYNCYDVQGYKVDACYSTEDCIMIYMKSDNSISGVVSSDLNYDLLRFEYTLTYKLQRWIRTLIQTICKNLK